ncbi:MAG: hypothetical protein K6F34_01320 [Lachnospiraceae bacterium]|nr:hypothetical protein [Lachnospiraceae bacterium]
MKILIYSLVVFLLIGYICIFMKGMDHSRLDEAYRMFYIDDSLKYWADMKELNTYRDNTVFRYNESGNFRNLGKGWLFVNENATWCVGNESDFYLYIDEPDKPHEVVIDLAEDMGYKNYITVNGVYQDDLTISDNIATAIISTNMHEGLNRIAICTDETVKDVDENNKNLYREDGRHNMYIKSIIVRY